MGYPEDLLASEERLLLHRHEHWKALIVPGLLFLVYTGLAIWGLVAISGADLSDGTALVLRIVLGVVWLGLFSWLGVAPVVRWASTHFVLTDRRVLFRTGIITRSGIDIPIARINTVQFRHGLIDRMFRTGTLIIESASDDPLEFTDIPEVEKVHAMLYNELYDEIEDEEGR
ncbi:PH domain-containing protein [Demequina sp. B12]|uniref:PH domain-containing protein n=1 Tax=Demequina sp. B12 TaxID=2992757 RepID=UPI00237A1C51|nr:PH domain-containing protein [Demequina sp. B12]MDE0572828.1 PH domain-containing protein [Demequina sp. B12]